MNNTWNKKKEKQLKKWINTCKVLNILHEKDKNSIKKQINRLLIVNILFSSIITICSSIAVSTTYYFSLIIISGILSTINTGIGIYKKSVNLESKLTKHIDSIRGYREIIFKIEQQLSLDINERMDGNTFIKDISLEMLNLESDIDSSTTMPTASFTKTNDNISYSSTDDEEKQVKMIKPKEVEEKPLNKEDDDCDDEKDDVITGLTPEQNVKFELFFRKNPSIKQEMLEFQMKRLDSV
jgi:hypothetical protein